MHIGKLEKVALREIWKGEAKDFTHWLEEHIEYLSEALDLPLFSPEREKHSGSFAIDLTAEDADGNRVIIECQLEKTDHDHLGKLITYLTSFGGKTAIWVCKDPRPEHVEALNWLNENAPADVSFYLVKVEGVRIGDSAPAPLFSIVCKPSEETKNIGAKKEEFAGRHRKRLEFWTQLLEKSKSRTRLHANISPGSSNSIGTGSGRSGLTYYYVITMHSGWVELYIDKGKDMEDANKQVFDALYAHKEQIEKDFGASLNWERLDNRRACRISRRFEGIGLRDEDKWSALQDRMIDGMISLEKSLKNRVAELPT